MKEKQISEYGRGLVICLTKFSEHFMNDYAQRIGIIESFKNQYKDGQIKIADNVRYSNHVMQSIDIFNRIDLKVRSNFDEAFSSMIETWANGATDHLYDLKVPKAWKGTYLGKKICELRKKGLTIGHGFTGKIWRYEDFQELQDLTRKIALLVDRKIGIDDGDLGEY